MEYILANPSARVLVSNLDNYNSWISLEGACIFSTNSAKYAELDLCCLVELSSFISLLAHGHFLDVPLQVLAATSHRT